MASYKVIQDIEAEEKLLGPLTLHQFIYAAVAATCIFLTYVVIARGVAFLAIIFLPPAIVSGFLAFPWGRDQPTEIWALAKIRFYLKPRKRIWNQSGQKEVVTVTAPKQENIDYTSGLSRGEVKSRLTSLAEMIDSHGWAIKGAAAPYVMPVSPQATGGSDRLVAANFANQVGPQDNIQASEDMLDEKNNPSAKRLTSMVEASSQARRQKIIDELNQTTPTPAPTRPAAPQPKASAPVNPKEQPKPKPAAPPKQPSNYWFLNQPSATAIPSDKVTFNTQVVTPGADDNIKQAADVNATASPVEEEILHELQEHEKQSADSGYYSHLPKVLPLEEQRKIAAARQQQRLEQRAAEAQKEVASHPQPTLAQQALSRNDDLNIATIARQAEETDKDGSVTISLR